MAFPFPLNPIDGQVATQTQADGSVLKATYNAAKNEWYVERVLPKDPSITLISGIPYTVPPAWTTGQVLTWDNAVKQWMPKTPTNVGSGGTFAKAKLTDVDTPNPPDPTDPKQTLKPGMLQSTVENLHKELKVWNGAAWVDVLSEDGIKQWIAAGALYQSVVKPATITSLPAPIPKNRGFYWIWAGPSNYIVQPSDTPIAPALTGEVINPGDWIQSDGGKYVHVPGDLLSKQRWMNLGSFKPWSDTSWEAGSIVSYQKSFFRSLDAVVTGDAAPGAGDVGPAVEGTAQTLTLPTGLPDGTIITIEVAPTGGIAIPFTYTTVAGDSAPAQLATNLQAAMAADAALAAFGTAAVTGGTGVTLTATTGTFGITADNTITTAVAAGGIPSANKWQDITPLPHIGLEDLTKVNANVKFPSHGEVFQWDDNVGEWVASDTLTIGAIRFDDLGLTPDITGFEATDFNSVQAGNENSTVPSVEAVQQFHKDNPYFLEELDDCKELSKVANGQVPVWDAAAQQWKPGQTAGELEELTNVEWKSPGFPPGLRDCLMYDANRKKWINDEPIPFVNSYSASYTYRLGDLVESDGGLYRCKRASQGHSPESSAFYWEPLSSNLKKWEPGKAWKVGDLVTVAWDKDYLKRDIAYSPNGSLVTVWRCIIATDANVPVAPNEPASVSNVPPGHWKCSGYDPLPIAGNGEQGGGLQNTGATVSNGNFVPIHPSRAFVVEKYADLLSLDNPVLPGDTAIVSEGGNVYRWYDHGHYDGFGWLLISQIRPNDPSRFNFDWKRVSKNAPGSIVVQGQKVYQAQASDTMRPMVIDTSTPRPITAFTGTFAEFVHLAPNFASFENKGTTDIALPLPLVGTLQPGQFLISNGLTKYSDPITIGGTVFQHGFAISATAPTPITFTATERDDYQAEWKRMSEPAAGEGPTERPDKWLLLSDIPSHKNWDDIKKYIDDAIAPLASAIEHGSPVANILNAPTGTEPDGTLIIVGKTPTGDFATHAGQVAYKDNGAWVFTAPVKNEAHMSETDNQIYHWNGNDWNSLGSVGNALKYQQMTPAAYAAVAVKDTQTLYLLTK